MHDAIGSIATTLEGLAGGFRMIPLLLFCDPCEREVNGEVFGRTNVINQLLAHGLVLLFPLRNLSQKGRFRSGICGFSNHGLFRRLFEVFENRIHRVVIFHDDRIGLMLVASRTSDGGGKESARHHIHTVIDCFDMSAAWAYGDEAQRSEVRVIGPIRDQITCELPTDEIGIRHVFIERPHQPIAIGVGKGKTIVLLEGVATGIRIARHIHPVPRPTLAIGGGS